MMLPSILGHMTVIPEKINTRGSSNYHKLVDVKRVNGRVVQKYARYLG